MSALRASFVAASMAWAVMLPLAPFVASRPHASSSGTALVIAVYGIGSVICHQLGERSYRLWTVQMPVCARCTGIYFGAAMMALASLGVRGVQAIVGARLPKPLALAEPPPTRALAEPRLTLALAVAPTLATLGFEWMTGHTPANWIRFAAGVPIGLGVAWLVNQHAHDERPGHPAPVGG